LIHVCIGEQALRTAQAKVDELLVPLKIKNNEKDALKNEIEAVSIRVRSIVNLFSSQKILCGYGFDTMI
jgi:hypothetical protein